MKKLHLIALAAASVCGAAPGAEDLVLWPSDLTEMRAQRDSKITRLPDGSMGVVTGTKETWPGMRMDFKGKPMDLSAYGNVTIALSNTTDKACYVNLSVKGRTQQGQNPGGRVALDPHGVGELKVDLHNMPWVFDGPMKLEGMRGAPRSTGGTTFDLRETASFHIFFNQDGEERGFSVSRVTAGGEGMRQKVLKAATFMPFVDKYGQFKHDEWPGKVHSDEELKATRVKEDEWLAANGKSPISGANKFGGWAAGPQLKATGFFRTEKVNGKWWLVDPEGRLFFSHGIDCVRSGNGATGVGFRENYFEWAPAKEEDAVFGRFSGKIQWPAAHGFYKEPEHLPYRTFNFTAANMLRKYGDGWEEEFRNRVHRRMKAWGINTIANWSDERVYLMGRTPYTLCLGTGGTPRLKGSVGWWGPLPDPFTPEFEKTLRDRARAAAAKMKNDPWCIGVFVDNELSWNKEPRMAEVADKYFSVISKVLKEELPNHLYLGCRIAWGTDVIYRACAKYCDVVSVNIYSRQVNRDLPEGAEDKPMINGEFHFGALDRGMFHTGLVGTKDQNERAQCYRDYVNACLDHPRFVGTHWFQWQDQALTGRGDGENYQIGFLNVADTPYPELVEAARDVASKMYVRRYGAVKRPSALAAECVFGADGAGMKNVLAGGDKFYTGCNYWASNAGMYMWRRWNPKAVEKDIAELSKNGVNIMRVFPLWPDFQPLTRLLGGGGADRGVCQNDAPLQNAAGVDEEMMRRFRFMCDVASKHDVKLVVGLITGWMSGRLFVPPAFEAKNVLTDAEVMTWQTRFVRHFVREMKDHDAIVGWDLGNECNCMAGADAHQSWVWMNTIASAIRLEDATRPVVSGMHGCSNVKGASWNLAFQGELMDELTTHPYPLFTPHCAKDPFNTMRSETHPTAESLLYWGLSGKHCFVEEAGDLGRCTASPERSGANIRCAMYTAWANGLGAYVWWCGFDQQHLEFPPYTWNAVERELGLFTKDYEAKPVLKEMGKFQAFLKSLPPEIAKLPPRQVDAVVLISDREKAWPSAFGAFMLSRQAGFDVAFADAEKRDLPEAKLYVLPSGDGCDPYSYEAWCGALKLAEKGATLLVSKGNGTRYSGFLEATGNEIDFFAQRGTSTNFELKDFPGRVINAWDSTRTDVTAKRSMVLGAAEDGRVMVTEQKYGKGKVIYCNFPIESDSVGRTDCFTGENVNPRYLVYKAAAKAAGIVRKVEKSLPGVGLTEHPMKDGRTVVVAVNYEPAPAKCGLKASGRVTKCWNGTIENGVLSLPANDAAVFVVE